jgi:ABC-2 type transport system permease protein
MAGGAVVFPAHTYGGAGAVLALLPSGALGSGMRTAFLHGDFPVAALIVLAGWAALGTLLTARTFTWE